MPKRLTDSIKTVVKPVKISVQQFFQLNKSGKKAQNKLQQERKCYFLGWNLFCWHNKI